VALTPSLPESRLSDIEVAQLPERGNPNWGQPIVQCLPAAPSEFEVVAERLKLSPKQYIGSLDLRAWCVKNRNRCYIPEWLLEAWQIEIDSNMA
jgi:hypothetical protein